jgi:DNA-directed RNA polymerase subunit RPC12/RpoP
MSDEDKPGEIKPGEILADAMYECTRCGTNVSGKELSVLPDPICPNCGYRIFRKMRGPTGKHVKAE